MVNTRDTFQWGSILPVKGELNELQPLNMSFIFVTLDTSQSKGRLNDSQSVNKLFMFSTSATSQFKG